MHFSDKEKKTKLPSTNSAELKVIGFLEAMIKFLFLEILHRHGAIKIEMKLINCC